MRSSRRRRRIVAGTAVLALLAGACTEDDSAGADDPVETDDASPTEAADDPAIPEETGAADDSAEPVVIGAINMDDGVPSFPGVSIGYDVAADYVNEHLGGIGGRPVEIRHCSVAIDPPSNQQCAQELANDEEVEVVVSGFAIGSDPIYPILEQAGLPVSIQTPLNQSDLAAPTGFSHYPGNVGISAGMPHFAIDQLDASKLVVVAQDNDGGRAAVQLIEQVPLVASSGATIEAVYVNDTAADVSGPMLAGGAADADAIIIVAPGSTCIQVANAAAQLDLDADVLGVSSCGEASVKDAVGDKVEGWYLGGNGASAALAPGTSAQTDRVHEIFEAAGKEDDLGLTSTAVSFGQIVMLWNIGNDIGADELSRESWLAGLGAFTGPVWMGPNEAACPGAMFPASCSQQSRISQIGADGVESIADGGQPIEPFGG